MWVPVRQAVASACACAAMLWPHLGAAQASAPTIPQTHVTALDGHRVSLPDQMPARATVLILGFGRHSQNATTAWEKPVRLQLAHLPVVGFYDIAMISEVPSFARSWVISAIRKQVPDVLKPNFLPLTENEDAWKRFAGYTADQPDAAYVLVVDAQGILRWSTHGAYSPEGFAQLTERAQQVAAESK